MKREIDIKYIFKQNEGADYVALYKRVVNALGELNIFAKFNIGYGYYQWIDEKYDWQRLDSATEPVQEQVKDVLNQKKTAIKQILGKDTIDLLFSIPDDSYIYFCQMPDGEVKVLLTGWGFSKPRGPIPPRPNPPGPQPKDKVAKIMFVDCGNIVPNCNFILKLGEQDKSLQTNQDGQFVITDFAYNKSYKLLVPERDKEFQLLFQEGKENYEFDITLWVPIQIEATDNNEPIVGEEVEVKYKGQSFSLTTDSEGKASQTVTYRAGENVETTLRNLSQHAVIMQQGCRIEYRLTHEIEHFVDVCVEVYKNGVPAVDEEVELIYDGQVHNCKTDYKDRKSVV